MKFNNIVITIASIIMLWGTSACSDDPTSTPLDKSIAEVENSTFCSLSFEWGKVKDAVQYSYQLAETVTGNVVNTDVTRSTTASFTGLKPSTDYTLTVLAYAAIGSEYTTSAPIVLTARTADIVPIATPQPILSREVNTATLEWDYVESAQSYLWQLRDADNELLDEGETAASYVSFSNMQSGTFTFTVIAQTDVPGLKNSEPGSLTFEFVRERIEVWRIKGTYSSALTDSEWKAELVAYDDNSYTIESWYGVENYDFTFTIDEQDGASAFIVSDRDYAYDPASQSYSIPTGLSDGPANVSLFHSQCTMEGSPAKGSISLNVSDGIHTGNDRFTWSTITCTIDDLCGEWTRHYYGYDNYYGEGYDVTMSVIITKVDDHTIRIPLPLFDNEYADVTVDLENMIYTLQPTPMNVGYTFASAAGEQVPLTGSISPTEFKMNNWGMFWSGYNDYVNTTMEFYREAAAE